MLKELDSNILLEVNNKEYMCSVSKKLNLTNQTCLKHIRSLEDLGLIERDHSGVRAKRMILTRSGQVIQEHLLVIRQILYNQNN